ncbi:hypothetical protein [Dokdonella sp.]|nr:hypothetical protein [Dokdonella sp.]
MALLPEATHARLATISMAHLYKLRRRAGDRGQLGHIEPTRST